MGDIEGFINCILGVIFAIAGVFFLLVSLLTITGYFEYYIISGRILLPFYMLIIISGSWLFFLGLKTFTKSKKVKSRFCPTCGTQMRWFGHFWCDQCKLYKPVK